jgi:hypothetical protein
MFLLNLILLIEVTFSTPTPVYANCQASGVMILTITRADWLFLRNDA